LSQAGENSTALSTALGALDGRAGVVIDVARARLAGANAAGLACLGFGGIAADGAPLDRGTPALETLATLLSAGPEALPARIELVFWSGHRLVRCLARVSAVDCEDGLVLAELAPIADAAAAKPRRRSERLADRPPGAAAAAPLPEPPLATADRGQKLAGDNTSNNLPTSVENGTVSAPTSAANADADTLKEIARRIRSGLADEGGDATLPAPSRPPPSPTGVADDADLTVAAPSDQSAGPPAAAHNLAIARLAHELRTPLSAIATLAEIIRDERLGAMSNIRYKGYASDIHESATHALSVLAALLDPAQAGDETAGLDLATTDLNAIIVGSVSAMRPLADRAGVKLTAAVADRLPAIVADRRTLKQILLNLVSNALRHTSAGGEIVVSSAWRPDGQVRIAVRDTGSGMSREAIRQALSAEAQARGRTASGAGSTGFGLPLVKALAEANGASIDIDSAIGEGTRVAVTFPAAPGD
jgi:signal transduction histidine kinase